MTGATEARAAVLHYGDTKNVSPHRLFSYFKTGKSKRDVILDSNPCPKKDSKPNYMCLCIHTHVYVCGCEYMCVYISYKHILLLPFFLISLWTEKLA